MSHTITAWQPSRNNRQLCARRLPHQPLCVLTQLRDVRPHQLLHSSRGQPKRRTAKQGCSGAALCCTGRLKQRAGKGKRLLLKGRCADAPGDGSECPQPLRGICVLLGYAL